MRRILFTWIVLGTVSAAGLAVGGCASSAGTQPYALTGDSSQKLPATQQAGASGGGYFPRPTR